MDTGFLGNLMSVVFAALAAAGIYFSFGDVDPSAGFSPTPGAPVAAAPTSAPAAPTAMPVANTAPAAPTTAAPATTAGRSAGTGSALQTPVDASLVQGAPTAAPQPTVTATQPPAVPEGTRTELVTLPDGRQAWNIYSGSGALVESRPIN